MNKDPSLEIIHIAAETLAARPSPRLRDLAESILTQAFLQAGAEETEQPPERNHRQTQPHHRETQRHPRNTKDPSIPSTEK